MVRRSLIWVALLTLAVGAQEPPRTVRCPYTFSSQGVTIKVQNFEVTRDERYVLVHAFLTVKGSEPREISWQGLFSVLTAKGTSLSPSGDCGVDNGTGLHITMGPFQVEARKQTRILVYFPLAQGELPVRLQFEDGAVTAPSRR